MLRSTCASEGTQRALEHVVLNTPVRRGRNRHASAEDNERAITSVSTGLPCRRHELIFGTMLHRHSKALVKENSVASVTQFTDSLPFYLTVSMHT